MIPWWVALIGTAFFMLVSFAIGHWFGTVREYVYSRACYKCGTFRECPECRSVASPHWARKMDARLEAVKKAKAEK